MKKVLLVSFLIALVGCSSTEKKEEVKVEEKKEIVSEASSVEKESEEDAGLIVEEEIEIVEVNDIEENAVVESQTEVVSQASSTAPVVTTYHSEVFANVQPVAEIEYVNADPCSSTMQYSLSTVNSSCGAVAKVYYDNGTTTVATTEIVSQASNREVLLEDTSVKRDRSFKSGFYHFAKGCDVHTQPMQVSNVVSYVPEGKKLWVEGYDQSWAKVYRRAGEAFISKNCLYFSK